MTKVEVGKITHYFSNVGVAVLKLSADLKVGEKIIIGGKSDPFEQVVESMQVEKQDIPEAKAGMDVGLKTAQPVKEGDVVWKETA